MYAKSSLETPYDYVRPSLMTVGFGSSFQLLSRGFSFRHDGCGVAVVVVEEEEEEEEEFGRGKKRQKEGVKAGKYA